MSVMNPNESSRTWRHYSRTPAVEMYLSDRDGRAGALVGERAAGFPLVVHPCEVETPIDASSLKDSVGANSSSISPPSIDATPALNSKGTTPNR